jgi:hypothetical protein
MVLQGRVSQELTTTGTTNGGKLQAGAIGADGRSFWAPLDLRGDFKISVPVGKSYKVVVVQTTADGKASALAHLVITGPAGSTEWVAAKQQGTLRLGLLAATASAAAAGTVSAGAVKTATFGVPTDSTGGGGGGTADTSSASSSDASGTSGSSGATASGGDEGDDDKCDNDDECDDREHADDAESHEGSSDDHNVCSGGCGEEVQSSRNDSVCKSGDYDENQDEDQNDDDQGQNNNHQ